MSIQFRFVIPAVVGLILLGIVTYALSASIHARGVNAEVTRRNEVVLAAVDREVKLASQHALEIASVVSMMPDVIEAYEQANAGNLDDESDPIVQRARESLRQRMHAHQMTFARGTGRERLMVHFHFPNARSFLRVWRDKQVLRDAVWVDISDDLSGFRATVVQVNRTGQPTRGIELGRGGFTIRGLVPIASRSGKPLGSVEVLAPLDEVLAGHLHGPEQRYALLMHDEGLEVTTSLRDRAKFPRVTSRRHAYVRVTPEQSILGLLPAELIDDARESTVHHWAAPFMITLHPVRDFSGKSIGVIAFATDQSALLDEQAAFRAYLAAATTVAVLVVGLALLALSRRVRKRITTTNARMRDLAEGPGDLDSRLAVSGRDEMAELARQFNALMDRLQASFAGVTRNMRQVLEMVGRSDEPGNANEKRALTLSEATTITEEIVDRVTATIEAWKQAERSRALLASIVESSDDAIYSTDLDGKVLSWNRGAEKVYGRSSSEMVGRNTDVLAPRTVDAESGETLDAIRRGEAQHYCETKRIRLSGEVFPVSVTFSPLHDEKGRLVGAAVIERDITQRREAEEAAARQHQQLVQADKLASLGTLVAGVAHEISNPNSFIMLNAPVIRDIWMDLLPHLDTYRAEHGEFNVGAMPFEACRDWVPTLLTDIENGADRIKGIVTSLKDYARQDPPTMRDLVDVNQVVRSAVTLTRTRLDKATRRLEVSIHDDLAPVRGSFQRIEQVVVNLILNACDALPSPDRGIRIGTRAGRNDGIEVFVEDEGTGMDARTLSRIRDPFFTTKRNSGGTGLGVSISDGIVHEHGGTLDFQSEEGKGTSVRVELPSASSHRDDLEAAS